MELAKIRNLSDEELLTQEKTTGEQLFRLRFQVSLGQNDGVKKLRELRKEIAQIKTVAKERELGIRGAAKEPAKETVAAAATTAGKAKAGKSKTATAKAKTGTGKARTETVKAKAETDKAKTSKKGAR
jgi:large subunit ribosomal protein L29